MEQHEEPVTAPAAPEAVATGEPEQTVNETAVSEAQAQEAVEPVQQTEEPQLQPEPQIEQPESKIDEIPPQDLAAAETETQEQMQVDQVPQQEVLEPVPEPPVAIEQVPEQINIEPVVETAQHIEAETVTVNAEMTLEMPVDVVPEGQEQEKAAVEAPQLADLPNIEETQAKLISPNGHHHDQENVVVNIESNNLMQLASLTDQQQQQVILHHDDTQLVDNNNYQTIVDPQNHQNAQMVVIDQANLTNLDQNGGQCVVVSADGTLLQDLTNGQQVVVVDSNGGQTYSNLTDLSNVQQVVMVDHQNHQMETVVVMATSTGELQSVENGTIIQNLGPNQDGSMVLDTSGAVDSSLMASTTLNMEEGEGEDDEHNEQTLKDIEESLAMSPSFASTTFTMNGTNVSTHTFRKTEWDVKKLENYVRVTYNDMQPIENMTPGLMNDYLKSFFDYAKKSDGMDYEPESLIGFMNSFERYLKTKNYPESLLRSETFKDARNILKKKRELVRSIGKLIRTKTKDTCYLLQFHRNLLKEKGLLSRDNPDCLLAEIYLNNMIFFGEHLKEDKAWRGNLNLVWGDMVLERDNQNGLEYLTLATWAKKGSSRYQAAAAACALAAGTSPAPRGKGKKTGASPNAIVQIVDPNSPRVYARQPASWCPVEAYKNYRSRRPNNCLDRDSPFYLAPLFKSKHHSKVWYKALAMSCQRLDALFYCLFKKAGVDLTSLASMSQQQQQQAVAAAASIINNDPLSASSQWKKDGMDDGPTYGSSGANGIAKPIDGSQSAAYHAATGTNSYYSGASNVQGQQQQHHIVTTVPAQVQVQVQVQVVPPHHHQQTVVAGNQAVATGATLLV